VSQVRLLLAATAAACLAGSANASAQDQSEIAGRRAALAKAIGEGTLVVVAAPEAAISRNGYVPDQNYLYLTGLREPGGALLMRVHGGVADSKIFVADKDPAAEVWTGVRMGVEGARTATGMSAAPESELAAAVKAALKPGDTLRVANDTNPGQPLGDLLQEVRAGGNTVVLGSAQRQINRLRALKSAAEMSNLRKAAELTMIGFDNAVAATAPGRYEFELEAALKSGYRRNGADGPDGFPPIIAGGDNATTLHYETNDDLLPPNGMVLMDVGAGYHDYVADFTRTVPVNGKFSADQRAFYQVVLDAQNAGDRVARSRANWATVNDSARHPLAVGLTRLDVRDLLRPVRHQLHAVRRGEVFVLHACPEAGVLRACGGRLRQERGALRALADDLVDVAADVRAHLDHEHGARLERREHRVVHVEADAVSNRVHVVDEGLEAAAVRSARAPLARARVVLRIR